MVYLITGKSGAGKTTYAQRLVAELQSDGVRATLIDGDLFRDARRDRDFSDTGRFHNLIDAAKLASSLESQGDVVVMAFVSPKRAWRDQMRALWCESKVVYIPGGTLWEGTKYERPTPAEDDWHRNKPKSPPNGGV